ncbi:MAG TPA: NAD(P)/FAD-dependent oxidoreductase [Polyangiaceae bacterium]|nr:NAD(P)/FAD-dependent oxidoreductase [Polyangiaceae bacterium]
MTTRSRARDDKRLVIVGGGLVGSLLAIYLSRRGYGVDVFDRQPDPRSTRIGQRPSVNLTLCERGIAALAAVGLDQLALARAVPVRGRRIHASDGTIAFQPYGNHGESLHSITRNELNVLLLRVALESPGVAYHFDEKCAAIDAARGTVSFENTQSGKLTRIESTKIFGADGAYSGVRAQLQKTERFDYSQQYASQGYKELTIPALPGGESPLCPDALHIWPRGDFMLIGFPNKNGVFTCALYAAFSGQSSFETLTDERRLLGFMRQNFGDIADQIPSLGEQFFARPANTMVTVRCRPWSRHGNVVLLGDAAHSILPSYGQGANSGFEDVAVLDRCMERYPRDWEAAFHEYEQLRRPNMDVMADLCVDHFRELNDRLGQPRFLARKALERRLQELHPDRFAPLYSTIAFTRTPYVEAVRLDRGLRTVVDRLMTLDGIEQIVDRPELGQLVQQCMTEVA